MQAVPREHGRRGLVHTRVLDQPGLCDVANCSCGVVKCGVAYFNRLRLSEEWQVKVLGPGTMLPEQRMGRSREEEEETVMSIQEREEETDSDHRAAKETKWKRRTNG